MPAITTHVLDISLGVPAPQVFIVLEMMVTPQKPELLSQAQSNHDGRVLPNLYQSNQLITGDYRITFNVKDYFSHTNRPCFFPQIAINFSITRPNEHHHIPLIVSPFGYSTYRGS